HGLHVQICAACKAKKMAMNALGSRRSRCRALLKVLCLCSLSFQVAFLDRRGEGEASDVALGSSPRLAASAGMALATLVALPAVTVGPLLVVPCGFVGLFLELAMLLRQSWSFCVLAGALGLPVGHGLLLIPSVAFQYLLPALLGPATGLGLAALLGGAPAAQMCLPQVLLLLVVHGACMLRVLKVGNWK
ncbi:unnamed protein product, partial [Effrenium voratum]